MDGDKLDFLEQQETDEAEVQPEAEDTEAPEPETKAEEAEPEATPEPEPTGEEDSTPPVEEPKSRDVPITAMLDEREKRQKAEREAEEARKQLQAIEARLRQQRQEQEQKKQIPDFYENPDERLQFEQGRIQREIEARTLKQSRFFAEREFGKDVVEQAVAWYDQNPQLSHQFMDHPSPFHAAVEFYKKQQFLNEVSDPDSWREQERQRIREEVMAELKSPQSKPKAPPASLANAPAAGTDAIVPGNAFDGLFGE